MGFLTGPFLYLAAAVFAAGTLWKAIGMARLPRHLRWELYPIPHLGTAGSKYQQVDFAARPRQSARWHELVFMANEILLLKKVYTGRRDLWLGSWLLHAGLYLGISLFGLLVLAALLGYSSWPPGGGPFRLLAGTINAVGIAAIGCGVAGSLYLLALRIGDRGLREMSDPVTFFNLGLLAALFGSGLWAWWGDPGLVAACAHLASLLRGRPEAVDSPGLASALILGGLFLAYLPFSRMFHPIAKYFFYHAILWDDEPMRPGSPMARDIARSLADRVTWSAAHIRQNESWRGQLADQHHPEGSPDGP